MDSVTGVSEALSYSSLTVFNWSEFLPHPKYKYQTLGTFHPQVQHEIQKLNSQSDVFQSCRLIFCVFTEDCAKGPVKIAAPLIFKKVILRYHQIKLIEYLQLIYNSHF